MKGKANFDDILKNAFVDTYFQPIISLSDGNVIGYEALSRGPRGTNYYMPTALIAEAKRRNRMNDLDILLRKMALINASKRNLLKPLFINIDPIAIYNGNMTDNVVRRSKDFGIPPHRVVVEVSEQNALCSLESFQSVIKEYKADGFQVAIDNITCNFSNFNAISCIRPNYVKISGRFVHQINVNYNINRINELNNVLDIARMIGAKIIAVGVENMNELKTLYRMGIDAVQGNFIGAPSKEISTVSKKALEIIETLKRIDLDESTPEE